MKTADFFQLLLDEGLGPFSGVPCSLVKDLINIAGRSKETEYLIATSEGEAMGIAAGLSLGRRMPVVVMQNDGLGNAINPLSSLQLLYDLPVLLLVTWRGEPGRSKDAPQHEIMGQVLPDLLKMFDIPCKVLSSDLKQTRDDVREAREYMSERQRPFALIIPRGLFEKEKPAPVKDREGPRRVDYMKTLASFLTKEDIVLSTTGFTGREAMSVFNAHAHFYMRGSMGCVTSLGLGMAVTAPAKRIFVLDGDGALLMKMGTLATVGYYQPENYCHLVFDNGVYESTGGQPTVSRAMDFPGVALHCSYQSACSVDSPGSFEEAVKQVLADDRPAGPSMIHIRVNPGTIGDLKRPEKTGPQERDAFRQKLRQ